MPIQPGSSARGRTLATDDGLRIGYNVPMARRKQKKDQIRTEFRRNYDLRARKKDFRHLEPDDESIAPDPTTERLTGRQQVSKKRTITGTAGGDENTGFAVELRDIDADCLTGRVIRVHGLSSRVRTPDGREFECATRGLLKSLATDLQNVVVTGDHVVIRPAGAEQGVILRVEPRRGVISRTSRQRRQILVANVDQVVIVASAAEPTLKPNLIDRLLVSCEATGLRPIICINKVDLVDPASLQPVVGVWGQMGYQVVLMSAARGWNVARLGSLLVGRDSVVTGQSGVGKSSLLNAIDPGLELKVGAVSDETEKGTHTTTFSRLVPLSGGGHIVDTPGIRQFQLWDVIPAEVGGCFRDIRPYVSDCQFPDCTHTHEHDCAVKAAVALFQIDVRRYESLCQIQSGE
jgi:ribosome biogenesis GTPase